MSFYKDSFEPSLENLITNGKVRRIIAEQANLEN